MRPWIGVWCGVFLRMAAWFQEFSGSLALFMDSGSLSVRPKAARWVPAAELQSLICWICHDQCTVPAASKRLKIHEPLSLIPKPRTGSTDK